MGPTPALRKQDHRWASKRTVRDQSESLEGEMSTPWRWLTWTPPGQVIEKTPQPEPPKPPKPSFEGFAGATSGLFQKIGAKPASGEGAPHRKAFPHCPRCTSYALYRANNIGDYECLTCKLRNITEEVARRNTESVGFTNGSSRHLTAGGLKTMRKREEHSRTLATDSSRINNPISRDRHEHQCRICSHPKRDEIERTFIAWVSPVQIAKEYSVSRDGVYRHANVFGLMDKRRRNVRAALERIIERAGEVDVTAAAVVAVTSTSPALSMIRSSAARTFRRRLSISPNTFA